MRIVIIIPTYNEAGSIGALLDEVRASLCEMPKYEWSVLVVDGHSTDGTAKIVREKAASDPAIYLFDEPEKRGIAMAYLTGIHHATIELHADAFIEFDGDGQHNPHEISRLVAKLDEGFDYVIGSRYIEGGGVPREWSWYRKFLSRYGSLYTRVLMGWSVKDVTSGFKLTRVKSFREPEKLLSRHYAYKIQLLADMTESGSRVIEVPITFRSREHDTSKSTWRDIVESLKVTAILRLRRSFGSKKW